jgi:hypothetical protein
MYVPATPDDTDEFQWDRPGSALADHRLNDWIRDHEADPLEVLGVDSDRCGGFTLDLGGGFAFEVFPEASLYEYEPREQWRLLSPGKETAHFVVLDTGVDED